MSNKVSTEVLLIIAVIGAGTVGVLGVVLRPEKATEIIGFTTLIAVSLFAVLRQLVMDRERSVRFDRLEDIGEKNHTLLNSNMGAALKLTAELSQWKADQTGTQEDRVAAELATKNYTEYMQRQSRVDRMNDANGREGKT